jgi:hypothetical protein
MGNQFSNVGKEEKEKNNELKPTSISHVLDYIATHYILTMDFKNLKKLYEKEYCDKLVILTSDIIQRYFTDLEITYLSQRVKAGVEINELKKDKVIFFNRDSLDKLDIQNSIKKKRICMSIAKFYIKIAHIFAAIVTTINPVYVYKDTEGNTIRASLYEKGSIPKNTPRDIYKLNICSNRINSLKNNNSLEPDQEGNITIGPKVCNMNFDDDGKLKSLEDEPGIPELEELYYDDNYDFNTGKFTGMSESNKKVFENDLKIFYGVFTGKSNANIPPEISKFSDIKLNNYQKLEQCQGSDPVFERVYKGSIKDSLFFKYAEHLKKMIQNANKNQEELLTIINQIFVYTIDPQTGKKQIRISPTLTEERLQEIVVETRALIIKLYLTCEMNYIDGLKIYEAITEQTMFNTNVIRKKKLEKILEDLSVEDKVPEAAEVQEIKDTAEKKIEEKKDEIEKQVEEVKKDQQIVNQDPSAILKDTSLAKEIPVIEVK